MRIFFLLAFFLASSSMACVNTYTSDPQSEVWAYKSSRGEMGPIIKKLEAENVKNETPETMNDLAVAYIFSSDYEKAVSLLHKLENKHPGLSKTAANLGTALELNGKNAEALHWIKQGILRDKNEHEGTEWLHVRILEAKIAVEKNPAWLSKNTVLGINFETKDGQRPKTPKVLPKDFLGQPLTLPLIEKALKYQLNERLKFVSPPDPYMADLYSALGNVTYLLKDSSSSDYYNAAKLFSEKPNNKTR